MNEQDPANPQDDLPSKSQAKREMRELQTMADELGQLPEQQLANLPASEAFRQSLRELRNLTHREARRRHLLHLGRRLLEEDIEALQRELDSQSPGSAESTRRLHISERWRERLLNEGKTALTAFVKAFPDVDVQHLRHLIRNASGEASNNTQDQSARRLYRFIREQVDYMERRHNSDAM